MLGLESQVELGLQASPHLFAADRQALNVYKITGGQTKSRPEDPILNGGFENLTDPTEPGPGLPDHKVTVEVPLCIAQFPFWLRAFFGAPATTGEAPDLAHAFHSGRAIQYLSLQHRLQSGDYRRHVGLVGEEMTVSLNPESDGFARVTMTFMGIEEQRDTVAAIGGEVAPEPTLDRPTEALAAVLWNAVAGGQITGGELTFKRNLKRIRAADGTGRPNRIEANGKSTLGGSVKLRYADQSLIADAWSRTERSVQLELLRSETRGIRFLAGQALLDETPIGADGPDGVEVDVPLMAYQSKTAPALTITALTPTTPFTGGGVQWDIHVNPLIGNDAFPGTFEQPKATIAAALATGALRIGLVRNQTYRERVNLTGLSGRTIGAYGPVGSDPLLVGSIRHTSGWTNVSGTIWEKDIGYTAVNCFAWAGGEDVTKFTLGTFAALTAGQFGVSGNLIRVNSAASPNTLNIEIPVNGTLAEATAVYTNGADNSSKNIRCWFWGQNGVEAAAGTSNFLFEDGDCSYNSNDGAGIHGTTTANVRFLNSRFKRNGQVRGNTAGAAGDGISYHDRSTGSIVGCTIIDNEKEGIGNQPSTSVVVEFNYLRNNYLECFVLSDTVAGAPAGQHDIRYNVIVWTPSGQGSGRGAIEVAVPASGVRPKVRAYNNVLFHEGAPAAGSCGVRVAGGDVDLRNNVIKGFSRGIDHRGTDAANASLVNDYNCMHGNTTNYFNNGAAGVVAGAHDVQADPLFANAAAGNFTLQAGSPCRVAGVGVGLTTDKAGNAVPATPDIGAYQYAA